MSLFKFFKKGDVKPPKPYSNYLHIKPIDRDTVDFADDFFFKLSDKQVDEKVREFQKKQQYIYRITQNSIEKLRSKQQQIILWKIALVVDYCYNKFYNEIPFITQKKVLDYANYILKDANANVAAGNLKRNLVKEHKELNQPYLMEFAALKQVRYCKDLHILNNEESLEIGLYLSGIIPLYSEEVIIKT